MRKNYDRHYYDGRGYEPRKEEENENYGQRRDNYNHYEREPYERRREEVNPTEHK